MKILVTGAAGFIGSHLCESLKEHEVIGLDNLDDFYDKKIKIRNLSNIGDHFHFEYGDIRNRNFYSLGKVDLVIHLAALAGVRPSLKNPSAYVETNILGTLNILDYCKLHDIKKMIFASSSSVYGNNKVPFREDMKIDEPISVYAATKKAGEELCYTYHHLYGINVNVLRFFTVYGPRQRPDLAIHHFVRLIKEKSPIKIYGDGTSKRDYTYIDDIVKGIKKAIDYNNGYEIFNLGGSSTIELNYLIEILRKELGNFEIKYISEQAGDVKLTYADISKASDMLEFKTLTNIEEGIKKFINWYESVDIC